MTRIEADAAARDEGVARWLAALDERLPAHAAVLRRLLAAARADARFRFVEPGASLARGAGDELSDMDLGLGIADEAWPEALDAVEAVTRSLAVPVAVFDHAVPAWGDRPHRRFFAQYRNGVQVDLVAMPASSRPGLPPGSIALYDPDGRLTAPIESRLESATADDIRDWAFLGWTSLADLDKYLRRGSPWQALQRLGEARAFAWQLWAVAHDVPYPAFGLTSVLDAAERARRSNSRRPPPRSAPPIFGGPRSRWRRCSRRSPLRPAWPRPSSRRWRGS